MSKEYCPKHHVYFDTDEDTCCPHFTYDDPCGLPYDPVPAEPTPRRKPKLTLVRGGRE